MRYRTIITDERAERRREVRAISDRYERWARTGSPFAPRWPEIATLLNEVVALDKELADLREGES